MDPGERPTLHRTRALGACSEYEQSPAPSTWPGLLGGGAPLGPSGTRDEKPDAQKNMRPTGNVMEAQPGGPRDDPEPGDDTEPRGPRDDPGPGDHPEPGGPRDDPGPGDHPEPGGPRDDQEPGDHPEPRGPRDDLEPVDNTEPGGPRDDLEPVDNTEPGGPRDDPGPGDHPEPGGPRDDLEPVDNPEPGGPRDDPGPGDDTEPGDDQEPGHNPGPGDHPELEDPVEEQPRSLESNPEALRLLGPPDAPAPPRRCERCGGGEPRPLPSCLACGRRCVCSAESAVDCLSCVCCLKALLYHCGDGEEDEDTPLSHRGGRGIAMATVAAALVLPCLLCYGPLRGCLALCQLCHQHTHRPHCRCHEV